MRRPGAEEFQHLQWPASTIADTRLAHSSASQDFRANRRRLLASSQSSAQAADGEGMIEYKPLGFNIDGDDFAKFFSRAHANTKATGEPPLLCSSPCLYLIIHCTLRPV